MPDTHPAITAILAQVDAWNRGSLDGYIDRVHPDVVYVHADGLVRGREALRARYARTFQTPAQMGRLSVSIEDAQLGTRQAALVLAWAIAGAAPQQGRALVVLVDGPGGWLLRHDATLA